MDLEWISSLLTSYYYNREVKYVIEIIERTIKRLKNDNYLADYVDNDVDIFVGAIVCRYGDYGTSPRYGWLETPNVEPVINALQKELEEYKEIESRLADEREEHGTR